MLALDGGTPVNGRSFEWNSSIDERDIEAAVEVLRGGVLSDFYGSPGPRFLGGKKVRELDAAWAKYFGVKYAVSLNSASSGLYAAVAALGLGPGDEVIVTPLSMAVSAVCVLAYGALPVFADVEPDYFCIDPKSVASKITERTKAIIAVNLFGQAADLDALKALATPRGIRIIEDNAQAPAATYKGGFTGTIGDIGIFSLNCHKAIQCGEGGVAVTNDDALGVRLQLMRNHAESVVEGMGHTDLANMVGANYRMTELHAAISLVQLSKLADINERKVRLMREYQKVLAPFSFIQTPQVRPDCTHVYYLDMMKYEEEALGIPRDLFVKAVNAEGFKMVCGYVRPIYHLPIFQKKIAIGREGWPFTATAAGRAMTYSKGLCPVAEQMHFKTLFYPDLIRYRVEERDIQMLGEAIEKVVKHADVLRKRAIGG